MDIKGLVYIIFLLFIGTIGGIFLGNWLIKVL